jgi:hypothetical protein
MRGKQGAFVADVRIMLSLGATRRPAIIAYETAPRLSEERQINDGGDTRRRCMCQLQCRDSRERKSE